MKTVGDKIKELRIKAGLTQKQLGDMLHVSYQAVSKWENGRGMPDSALFPQIATILNTTVNQLFYDSDKASARADNEDAKIAQKSLKKRVKRLIALLLTAMIVITSLCVTIFIGANKTQKYKTALVNASLIYNGESNLRVECITGDTTYLFIRKYFFDGRKILYYSDGVSEWCNYGENTFLLNSDGVSKSTQTQTAFLQTLPNIYTLILTEKDIIALKLKKESYIFRLKTLDNLPIAKHFGFTSRAIIAVQLKDGRLHSISLTEGKNTLTLNYSFGYNFEFAMPSYVE